jgi:peptide/nickel transport system substrate-binding protein
MLSALLLSLVAFASQEVDGLPRPGAVEVDRFHPERTRAVQARRGGEVALAVPALPPSLNAMIESSGVARAVLYETHESLLRRNWETWELEPALAKSVRVERDGDELAYVFELREGVKWHDGHSFDARDVLFSYECFRNPHVRCDRKRGVFEKLASAELTEDGALRFEFAQPYFLAESAFDETFTILPSHVYDLSDPDNPRHKANASAEEQGRFVGEHEANRKWIGLGPYRVTNFGGERIEAERFEGYFDPAQAGYLEKLRWRAFGDAQAALNAMLEGELDFFDRLSVEDYFGERTSSERFTQRLYKGLIQTPSLSVTAWNLAKPELADVRVRTALALASNWEAIRHGVYRGLATRVTGEQPAFAPHYDRELAPLPFERSRAERLLGEAGWIDRDGDGLVDKDGRALEIDYLHATGVDVTSKIAQALQADLAEVGVKLNLVPRDPAAFAEALRKREFEAAALTLATTYANDPEPLWHSKWAAGASANRWGLRDEKIDALLGELQSELVPAKRDALFKQLQARVYEQQPCMFGLWAARRFALSKRVRGVQLFALDPGYSLRRWYVAP